MRKVWLAATVSGVAGALAFAACKLDRDASLIGGDAQDASLDGAGGKVDGGKIDGKAGADGSGPVSGKRTYTEGVRCSSYSTSAWASAVLQCMHQCTGLRPL